MRKRRLHTTAALLISALLLGSFYLHFSSDLFPLRRRHHHHHFQHHVATGHLSDTNLAITELHHLSPPPPESVLLPGWEVLVLLPPGAQPPPTHDVESGKGLSCVFQNGAATAATPAGVIPSSGRASYRCILPNSMRSIRPFYTPHLSVTGEGRRRRSPEMVRWNRLAYESFSTPDDVIVFAKGVNTRQGAGRSPVDLNCTFLRGDGEVVAVTAVTSSAQEVFRCHHPPPDSIPTTTNPGGDLRVSIHVRDQPRPIQSLATYHPPPPAAATSQPARANVCACTMVYNVAKFLPEWVAYHSAIGVERFILYDNGSEDDLDSVVSRLVLAGHNVTTSVWPWAKAQEAGFSHCAVAHQDSCAWMAFLDVDEFLFSPKWANSNSPEKSMLASLLPPISSKIGQVTAGCLDFGASGRRSNPEEGVTQGYTCRKAAEERHKAVVRLEAVVKGSLVNQVHHFGMEEGWKTRRMGRGEAAVNHYKYQAWEEFRRKFRRRVSAFVADWTEAANLKSRDRTPGLGKEAVEPPGWEWKFCEVNDTRLKGVTARWFGVSLTGGDHKIKVVWE